MKKILIMFLLTCGISIGQISLDGVGSYTQNFDSLASSLTSSTTPFGWTFSESGTNANTTYTAGTGSSNTGDTYSFGATSSNERAFGGLLSGSLVPIIGANFRNNSGSTITQIPISYTGEQWRAGVTNRGAADRLDFQFSTDATSLLTGTWTNYDALDFNSPNILAAVGALDGNASGNRTMVNFTITGLSIANGATFWIRWTDFNITSSDDGLAIDDFSIDESALPVELSSFTAEVLKNGSVQLNWRTETEVNNFGFEVERSQKSNVKSQTEWTKIGFVEGHGNSNSPKDYSFTDDLTFTPKLTPVLRYRLKQIDTDGKFEYSKVIEVDLGSPGKFELSQNYPNPFNPVTTIKFSIPQSGYVKLMVYNALGEQIAELVDGFKEAGIHTINYNASDLNSGLYIYKLEASGIIQSRKMMLLK